MRLQWKLTKLSFAFGRIPLPISSDTVKVLCSNYEIVTN